MKENLTILWVVKMLYGGDLHLFARLVLEISLRRSSLIKINNDRAYTNGVARSISQEWWL
jgi:hypothetical protein